MAHKGSWGTPDFGLTEWVSSLFGNTGRTAQGGSNMKGSTQDTAIIKTPESGGYIPTGSGWSAPQTRTPSTTPTSSTPTGSISSSYSASSSPSGSSSNTSSDAAAEAERIRQEEERIRNQISSGFDQYIGSLDNMLEGLSTQRGSMEDIRKGQLNQFQTTLGAQKEEGLQDLQGERQKTEKAQQSNFNKLAEDLRNQMQAGNIYLGARGAGDSSAANMYSYALGRQGSQIRGDLMSQTADIQNEINKREGNLKRVYDTEMNNAQTEYNNGMSEIARWFAEQQAQIEQMKGSASKDKALSLAQLSMDILNQAKQAAQELQDHARAKQDALDQWAINNSNTINEVKSNLASLSNYYAPGINMGKISGAMQTSQPQTYARQGAPVGIGSNEEDKNLTNIFG